MRRTKIYTLCILISLLCLNGCFHKPMDPLNELTSLLDMQENVDNYSFTGVATIIGEDQIRHDLDWTGNATTEPNYIEMSITSSTSSNEEQITTILYDGTTTYTHIPTINREREWITTSSFPWKIDRFDHLLVNDLIQQHADDSSDPVYQIDTINSEHNERIIQFTPDENIAQRWWQQLHQQIELLPTALRLLFDQSNRSILSMHSATIQMHFDENNQLLAYEMEFHAEDASIMVKQSYERYQSVPERTMPNDQQHVLLSAEQIWNAAHLLANETNQTYAYDQFEESIELIDAYEYDDADRQQIIDRIKSSMQALIERANEPMFAELFGDVWTSDRKFRLKSIEDLTGKSLNRKARIAVVYEYIDKGQQMPTINGFVFTLAKDETGNWHIQSIE